MSRTGSSVSFLRVEYSRGWEELEKSSRLIDTELKLMAKPA